VVYAAYTAYESTKNAQGGWDRCDLAAHLYQQLVGEGYQGVPLDGVYRDEVQDFTQAELLLDLRVCADPNAMFYCGDTCQVRGGGQVCGVCSPVGVWLSQCSGAFSPAPAAGIDRLVQGVPVLRRCSCPVQDGALRKHAESSASMWPSHPLSFVCCTC
jgi:hypothetical protein